MIVYIIQREGVDNDIALSFANELVQTCGCITRVVSEDSALSIIKVSHVDEIIDLNSSANIVIHGDSDVVAAFANSDYASTDYEDSDGLMNLISGDTILGIEVPTYITEDDIRDICMRCKDLISISDHNWYKDEKGWWSVTHGDENGLLSLTKNGITKLYCVDEDLYMKTGWQDITIDDRAIRLYFDPEGGELNYGWNRIDGVWYYFGSIPPFVLPSIVNIGDASYIMSADGILNGYTKDSIPEGVIPEVWR